MSPAVSPEPSFELSEPLELYVSFDCSLSLWLPWSVSVELLSLKLPLSPLVALSLAVALSVNDPLTVVGVAEALEEPLPLAPVAVAYGAIVPL